MGSASTLSEAVSGVARKTRRRTGRLVFFCIGTLSLRRLLLRFYQPRIDVAQGAGGIGTRAVALAGATF